MSKIYTEKDRQYFEVPADELAQRLLGKILCRRLSDDTILRFRLTQTEAYGDRDGRKDSACHANKYKKGNAVITQRMPGGTIYVHYKNNGYPGSSFDIVAGKSGEVQSVLIRGAVELSTGKQCDKIRLLGAALHIDYEKLNQTSILASEEIWLEDDGFNTVGKIKKDMRIRLGKYVEEEDRVALRRYILSI